MTRFLWCRLATCGPIVEMTLRTSEVVGSEMSSRASARLDRLTIGPQVTNLLHKVLTAVKQSDGLLHSGVPV